MHQLLDLSEKSIYSQPEGHEIYLLGAESPFIGLTRDRFGSD